MSKIKLTDDEVITRIKQGDESALDYLYQKNYKMMVNMIIKNSGSQEEAEDIYQEALILFWRKITSGNLVLTSKISTYLYSVCQNLWRKELERKSRLSNEEKEEIETNDYDAREQIKIIHQSIGELGEVCRQILTLYYFDGLSMDIIAQRLGFSNADSVKTKKYKCKKELDEKIKAKFSVNDFLD